MLEHRLHIAPRDDRLERLLVGNDVDVVIGVHVIVFKKDGFMVVSINQSKFVRFSSGVADAPRDQAVL